MVAGSSAFCTGRESGLSLLHPRWRQGTRSGLGSGVRYDAPGEEVVEAGVFGYVGLEEVVERDGVCLYEGWDGLDRFWRVVEFPLLIRRFSCSGLAHMGLQPIITPRCFLYSDYNSEYNAEAGSFNKLLTARLAHFELENN